MGAGLVWCLGVVVSTFAGAYEMLGARDATIATGPSARPAGRLEAWVASLPMVRESRRRRELERRRRDALRQLPTMMDVVTLGLAAGLSFDASLELYCQHYRTSLSGALAEAMLTWRLGTSTRGEALCCLADELGVIAMRRFADAVSQALAFGAPLSATLELQAQAIREEQRAELEAEIERVPVRMLIPLGTLIVPAMLLAILGPLLGPSVVMVG